MNDEPKTQPKHEDYIAGLPGRDRIIYRDDLELAQCANPQCKEDHNEMLLSSSCCDSTATNTTFDRKTGLLVVRCYWCDRPMVRLALACRKEERPS